MANSPSDNQVQASSGVTPDVQLSVIIPTYNESENIPILLKKLSVILAGLNYELIVVDDNSPDKTWAIAQEVSESIPQVKVIRRMDENGLSSAVTTGMLQATGRVMAVMDADLQHDEAILPKIYSEITDSGVDICVGSREAEGGSYGDWSRSRKIVSFSAKLLAKLTVGPNVSDPMSGFFAVSREYFDRTIDKVNPSGFKILLEFLVRGENPKVSEVGYKFRNRLHGETKINATVAVEYVLALIDLRFGWLIPNRFVKFGIVGLSGSLVNFTGFAVMQAIGVSISIAVVVGVELAILWTYIGNNFFTFTPMTYRDKNFFAGLVLYHFVGIYGLVIQLSVLDSLLNNFPVLSENLITLYITYLVAVAFAAIGNYFLHSYYTWNRLGFSLNRPTKRSTDQSPGIARLQP